MKICQTCNRQNDDNCNYCTFCGNKLPSFGTVPTQNIYQNTTNYVYNQNNPATNNNAAGKTNKQSTLYPKRTMSKFAQLDYEEEMANKSKVKKPLIKFNLKKIIFFKNKKNILISASVVAALSAVLITIPHVVYSNFVSTYNKGQHKKAVTKVEAFMYSPILKSKLEDFSLEKVSEYYRKYVNGSITYEDFMKEYKLLDDFTPPSSLMRKATELNNSNIAFEKGLVYENTDDTYNAILEFKKVIPSDKNYSIAQEKLDYNMDIFKQETINSMEAYVLAGDYDGGLKLVENRNDLFYADEDIRNYETKFNNMKEEHRIQKLKDEQKAVVISTRMGVQHKTNKKKYPDMLLAVVKNNSDKTIKTFNLSFLTFDAEGNPLSTRHPTFDEKFEFNTVPYYKTPDPKHRLECLYDSDEVLPGKRTSERYGWELSEDHPAISTILACVSDVTYTDGTTWRNEYFDIWLKQYENKKLN